jgi:hypothetical protein
MKLSLCGALGQRQESLGSWLSMTPEGCKESVTSGRLRAIQFKSSRLTFMTLTPKPNQ